MSELGRFGKISGKCIWVRSIRNNPESCVLNKGHSTRYLPTDKYNKKQSQKHRSMMTFIGF